MSSRDSVLVTGGTGLVGSALQKIRPDWTYVGTKDYNLQNQQLVRKMLLDVFPTTVIHLAAKVGGVKANTNNQAEFFSANVQMNQNILTGVQHYARPSKVISMLSTCVYPDKPKSYPLTEDQLHAGPPHHTNYGYAYAKRMVAVQSKAYNEERMASGDLFLPRYMCAIPNNIYGPDDNFDLENSHVVPALIRKIHQAKLNNVYELDLWGTGLEEREFTYSGDIARALVIMAEGDEFLEDYRDTDALWNIGQVSEVTTIHELADRISDYLEHRVHFHFVGKTSEAQVKKPSSNEKFTSALKRPFKYTCLDDGLKATCEWYLENYPNIRGINK
jgi:GDP-L-fucose synthase